MSRKNHYILEIVDHSFCAKRGYKPRLIFSAYFDGTEAQAHKEFLKLPQVQRYKNRSAVLITFRANPVVISDKRELGRDY